MKTKYCVHKSTTQSVSPHSSNFWRRLVKTITALHCPLALFLTGCCIHAAASGADPNSPDAPLAQSQSVSPNGSIDELFREALVEEELNQDLPAAIKAYKDVIAKLDANRKMAATALFHLGECYRKEGRKKDAVLQYRRVLQEFADQPTIVNLCEASLRNLGVAEEPSAPPESNRPNNSVVGQPVPLAEWVFAQKDGDIVPDATGHGYNANIYGHPKLITGPGGSKALEFDAGSSQSPSTGGSDANGEFGAENPGSPARFQMVPAGQTPNAFWSGGAQASGLGIAKRLNRRFTELSLEAWLRKSPGWWMPIIYRDLWNDASGFALYAEWSSGKVAFGHYDDSGNKSEVFSDAVVQDGRWHHVVGTMQALADSAYLYRIYVDGQLDKESTGTLGVEEAPPEGGILKIAYPNSSGADQPYQGALGNIAIYDVALTPAQVKTRFEAGRE
jgi:Concanavalin A-like lectin/glucanases superfamily/Tetratricopeptide repeat